MASLVITWFSPSPLRTLSKQSEIRCQLQKPNASIEGRINCTIFLSEVKVRATVD